MIKIENLAFTFFILAFVYGSLAYANDKQIEKDTDGDGKIDQIALFDVKGKIDRLEIDSNKDGFMDRFQYYKDEKLIRIERDIDFNLQIDCLDYFKEGKKIRQERVNGAGKVRQITLFDEDELAFLMKKDTSDNGNFDTIYYFTNGHLISSTRDTNENGKVNVWYKYQNKKPLEKKEDDDEDGRIESIVLYDAEGLPKESRHDLDNDGKFETFRFYQNGEIAKQQNDTNLDGLMDSVTIFQNSQPFDQKKDSNFDGEFDIFTTFKNGKPFIQNKDTNFDKKIDYFSKFDGDGFVKKIEEDTRYSARIDRLRFFEKGIPVRVEYDANGDGFLVPYS